MSGRQIDNATIGNSWETEVESKNLLKKGFYNMEFTNIDTVNEPLIIAGSAIEVNGVLYSFDSNETITGTPTSGKWYVVVSISSGVATAQYTSEVPPLYDNDLRGYYTATGSRYVFGFTGAYDLKYYMDESYSKRSSRGLIAEADRDYAIKASANCDFGVYGHAVRNYGVYGKADFCYGVYGCAPNFGVYGYATNYGVKGEATNVIGVLGTAINCGVHGVASCCYGVYGKAICSYGVYGKAHSNGVMGEATCSSGVYGYSCGHIGVHGVSQHNCGVLGSGVCFGIYGTANCFGVCGRATNGVAVSGNTSYCNSSDEHLKIQKESISVLSCLRAKPIQQFKWRWERAFEGDLEYIAPMAQDVQDTFNLDDDSDGYSTLDGIALFGVQELMREVEKLKLRIKILEEK